MSSPYREHMLHLARRHLDEAERELEARDDPANRMQDIDRSTYYAGVSGVMCIAYVLLAHSAEETNVEL